MPDRGVHQDGIVVCVSFPFAVTTSFRVMMNQFCCVGWIPSLTVLVWPLDFTVLALSA